jgi:hypothetical protein
MKIKQILNVDKDVYLELMAHHDNREWRVIEDFENYEINPIGLIRNRKTKKYIKPYYSRTVSDAVWTSVKLRANNHESHRSIRTLIRKTFGDDYI